jgi:predicted PurR-regulated permease PerM
VIGTSIQRKSQSLLEEQVHSYALPTIAAGVIIAILYWARVVFITTIISVIIALILEPFVGILIRVRIPRPLATLIVGATAALGLYFAGLAAYNQLSGLASDVPAFKENLTGFITGVTDRIEETENATSRLLVPAHKTEPAPVPAAPPARAKKKGGKDLTPPPPQLALPIPGPVAVPGALAPPNIPEVRIHEDRNPIADYVYARLGTVYEFLLMASFVPFLVYFMLSWRDHIYRSFLRFFEGADRVAAARSLEGVAEMARAFVAGNFMIGLFLAAVSWAAFAMIHIPYPFLVGVLSGFLSLVPYVGMPVALVPPVLASLAGGQHGSVILIAFFVVLTLHLTAMNVLYPKIVGARVHLNPLVVTFSLMFWGFLWDAGGLLLAIPITAGIKAVCDNVAGLRLYGRFLGD